MRRLEREDLLVLVQRGFDFRQRRTRTRRDHQFRRLIMNDTAMTTGVQRFSHGRTAEKSLGIAADDAERRRTRERIAHLCLESLRLISVHARAIVLGWSTIPVDEAEHRSSGENRPAGARQGCRAFSDRPGKASRKTPLLIEKRRAPTGRVSGRPFFWLLFFGRAKKSNSPAVRKPHSKTHPC